MRPTDIVLRVMPDGTSTVHLDGVRVEVKQLAIVATAGEGCEVTLTLTNCTVNHEFAGPDTQAAAEPPPERGSVFMTLCQGCGKLFRNGDGHTCA